MRNMTVNGTATAKLRIHSLRGMTVYVLGNGTVELASHATQGTDRGPCTAEQYLAARWTTAFAEERPQGVDLRAEEPLRGASIRYEARSSSCGRQAMFEGADLRDWSRLVGADVATCM
jgi:hypothetical protein